MVIEQGFLKLFFVLNGISHLGVVSKNPLLCIILDGEVLLSVLFGKKIYKLKQGRVKFPHRGKHSRT